ncbi:MAG: DUF2911 domain-containing protein [Saprospiraceae bacterium]
MKNVLSALCFLFVYNYAFAQIKVPAASPLAKSEYTVGLTTINTEYSRPSKNNRKIYGELVPYNTLWRTGANKNSMITFSDDVVIGGSDVKKGTYAIFAKPTIGAWEIFFYSNTENWGTPEKWDDALVAAKVMATPIMLNTTVETFTINIGNLTNASCVMDITWENLSVPVKIEVPTDKKVTANITQVMAGTTANDYYNAARYYREAKKDLTQALAWMEKSVAMGNNKFWHMRQKSLIEADMGNYSAAIASANESLKLATEAGNNDYIKMNNDSIAEWSKKKK